MYIQDNSIYDTCMNISILIREQKKLYEEEKSIRIYISFISCKCF